MYPLPQAFHSVAFAWAAFGFFTPDFFRILAVTVLPGPPYQVVIRATWYNSIKIFAGKSGRAFSVWHLNSPPTKTIIKRLAMIARKNLKSMYAAHYRYNGHDGHRA